MLRRFMKLTGADRRLAVEAAILQVVILGGLRVVRFGVLRSALERASARRTGQAASAARVAWAVNASSGAFGRTSTCLSRALTAELMLVRRGCQARTAIGVHPPHGGVLHAHAWVESRGTIVVGGAGSDQFALLTLLGRRDEGAKS